MIYPKDFWNSRFQEKEYVYGKLPNEFLAAELKKLNPGKILFPAEGEGRNAVFAAKLGWEVTAFDISDKGREKALILAKENEVSIHYSLGTLQEMPFEKSAFDTVASIFAHFPPLYQSPIAEFLRPGGTLILEGFAKEQIEYQKKYNSGGPKKVEMLFDTKELAAEFSHLNILLLEELEVTLDEGPYHSGLAKVVRMVAKAEK